ncbi:MAG: DUF4249 family protein [Sphingobacteriaceae bacterium]|nr:MAG: DUF4249 family protein [Sphingobacteriaceae bacterium]
MKYSILVKQYAMTKQEFEFWEIMKKNTEQLGTIFDPQPSQVKGNIHCVTDPAEVVIGYLGVCTVVQKRNYIDKSKLMQFSTKRFYTDCTADSVLFERIQGNAIIHEEDIYFNRNYILIPLDAITTPFGDVIGHMGTAPRCADCTLRGTKNKPAFWE